MRVYSRDGKHTNFKSRYLVEKVTTEKFLALVGTKPYLCTGDSWELLTSVTAKPPRYGHRKWICWLAFYFI